MNKMNKQEPKSETRHHASLAIARATRDAVLDRALIADAILRKMSFGTFKMRKSLLSWLKVEQKITGFDLATLKKFGLTTEHQIQGKLGAEAKALRKANLPIFLDLCQHSAADLQECFKMLSDSSIQRRYGRRIADADIGVKITLKETRKVEVGSKRELSNWQRSKANRETAAVLAPVRQEITRKLKARKRKQKHHVTQSVADYVGQIKSFGKYVVDGLKKRREWMNTLERRANSAQKMSNMAAS